nr:hypothetical protein [Tanacetum cinerariifolium]
MSVVKEDVEQKLRLKVDIKMEKKRIKDIRWLSFGGVTRGTPQQDIIEEVAQTIVSTIPRTVHPPQQHHRKQHLQNVFELQGFWHILNEFPKKIVPDAVKNLNNPRHATIGVPVGLNVCFKSTKQVYKHVSNKNGASISGKKKQVEIVKQEVSNSNLFDALNSIENDDDLGTNGRISKSAEMGSLNVAHVKDTAFCRFAKDNSTAFCLISSCVFLLRFGSTIWFCVLLIEDISCVFPREDSAHFKTWLRFVSRLLAFCLKTFCVLSQDLVAFCLKTSCVLSQDLPHFVSRLT